VNVRAARERLRLFRGTEVLQHPIGDHADVSARAQKLHDFRAFAGHFCPSRFGLRILLQAAKFHAVHFKINLCQAIFACSANGEGRVADSYNFLLFHERLTPHGDEYVIDGEGGVSFAQARLFFSEIASARAAIPAPSKSNEPGSGTLVKLPTISPESLMPLREVSNLSPLLGAV